MTPTTPNDFHSGRTQAINSRHRATTSSRRRASQQDAEPFHDEEPKSSTPTSQVSATYAGDHHERDVEKATPPADPTVTPPMDEESASGGRRDKEAAALGPDLSYTPTDPRRWPDNLVTFDGPNDPANPKNWSFRRKVALTMLMGSTTMCSTFASSVISSGVTFIADDFNVSTEVATLTVSLFVLGYVPGPIIFAPLSEMFGRRNTLLAPMLIFLAFSAGSATAKDIQTLMITRFFGGFFASAPVSNVAGGLADMWDQKERATAVVLYSMAVVGGPTLGPIIGAAVSQSSLGWRWTEYLTVILIAFMLILDIIFLSETFVPVLLTRKARRLRLLGTCASSPHPNPNSWILHSTHEMQSFTFKSIAQKTITRPLLMLVREPIVACVCAFNAFAYGILYLLFAAFPIEFQEVRGWNDLQGSLPFLAVLVGVIIAGAVNIVYSIKVFGPIVDKYGSARPEHRLPPMMLGAILFPIGFFWFGWTYEKDIHWVNDVLASVVIGTSFLLIFQAGINYLIDAFTMYSASAIAANTFLRSFFAAAFPLVAQPLFHNLGVNWACTLLGLISVALAGVPFVFYYYGPKLRGMSRFAHKALDPR